MLTTYKTKFFRKLMFALVLSMSIHSIQANEHQTMVFEMRTYTTFDGKLNDLNARFRNHTIMLFEKHGMKNIGYWIPEDKTNTLIYIIAHKNKLQAAESWKRFINDPKWQEVYKTSIAEGKLVAKIESVFMSPTDYSKIH